MHAHDFFVVLSFAVAPALTALPLALEAFRYDGSAVASAFMSAHAIVVFALFLNVLALTLMHNTRR